VADIERGGVFASIYGTYNLLPQHLKSSIIGVIINKFRGDISLFEDGVKIIEEQFGIKVLGVVPYINTQIGIEDSLSLNSYTKNKNAKIKIAVIKLPKISNFNDFEALIADKFVELSFIDIVCDFNTFDIIIIPGSKATITDLRWLKATGIFDAIKESSSFIFGVCGGYQMMFENIYDTDAIECNSSDSEAGFRLIDDDIVFKKQKTVQKKEYNINGARLFGYEIHCGVSKKYPIYFSGANFFGTHLHAIFENDNFRTKLLQKFCKDYIPYSFAEFRENSIKNLVETVSKNIDIDYILKAIDE
jgi:adenosylcobyric acid synthase